MLQGFSVLFQQTNPCINKVVHMLLMHGNGTLNAHIRVRPPDKSAEPKVFSYFSTKTYVVGNLKNHLNEMFVLAPKTYVKQVDTSSQASLFKDLGQSPIQSAQILTACC